jgi:hypothetical protein
MVFGCYIRRKGAGEDGRHLPAGRHGGAEAGKEAPAGHICHPQGLYVRDPSNYVLLLITLEHLGLDSRVEETCIYVQSELCSSITSSASWHRGIHGR